MIKVVLYEDDNQLRDGLTMIIQDSEGFMVVNSCCNCNHVQED